jgi:hypothetical protein
VWLNGADPWACELAPIQTPQSFRHIPSDVDAKTEPAPSNGSASFAGSARWSAKRTACHEAESQPLMITRSGDSMTFPSLTAAKLSRGAGLSCDPMWLDPWNEWPCRVPLEPDPWLKLIDLRRTLLEPSSSAESEVFRSSLCIRKSCLSTLVQLRRGMIT